MKQFIPPTIDSKKVNSYNTHAKVCKHLHRLAKKLNVAIITAQQVTKLDDLKVYYNRNNRTYPDILVLDYINLIK